MHADQHDGMIVEMPDVQKSLKLALCTYSHDQVALWDEFYARMLIHLEKSQDCCMKPKPIESFQRPGIDKHKFKATNGSAMVDLSSQRNTDGCRRTLCHAGLLQR